LEIKRLPPQMPLLDPVKDVRELARALAEKGLYKWGI
jgi:hypothetical protein